MTYEVRLESMQCSFSDRKRGDRVARWWVGFGTMALEYSLQLTPELESYLGLFARSAITC